MPTSCFPPGSEPFAYTPGADVSSRPVSAYCRVTRSKSSPRSAPESITWQFFRTFSGMCPSGSYCSPGLGMPSAEPSG